jgi:hypothetical protein
MTPIPTVWWLRPVSKAARVGAHRAVVWKRLYFEAVPCQPLGRRCRARPAERTRSGEADVVEQNDEHVWRAGSGAAAARSAGTSPQDPWRPEGALPRTACPGSAGRHVNSGRSLSTPLRRPHESVGTLEASNPACVIGPLSSGCFVISFKTPLLSLLNSASRSWNAVRTVADSHLRTRGRTTSHLLWKARLTSIFLLGWHVSLPSPPRA